MSVFSEALVRERQRMHLSRRDVADRCGVGQAVVRKWEAGEGIPNPQQFKLLATMIRRLGATPPDWQNRATVFPEQGEGALLRAELRSHYDELERADPTPRVTPDSFGAGMRRIREDNEVTQETLAELLGVHATAVGAWERDEASPVRENFNRMLEVLPELRVAMDVGAVRRPSSRDIPKPSGNPDGGASRVDPLTRERAETAVQMAMEQSDREVQTPKQPVMSWNPGPDLVEVTVPGASAVKIPPIHALAVSLVDAMKRHVRSQRSVEQARTILAMAESEAVEATKSLEEAQALLALAAEEEA